MQMIEQKLMHKAKLMGKKGKEAAAYAVDMMKRRSMKPSQEMTDMMK